MTKVRANLELKGLCFQALSVDTDMRTVTFDDGTAQTYDQLLISTGCRWRQTHTAKFASAVNLFSKLVK